MESPEQYISRIAALVEDGADEQIIALTRKHGHIIHPQLSDDELDRLFGVIESALMAHELRKADRGNRD